MSGLNGITNQNVRQAIGTRCFNSAGLAIHGTTLTDALIANAVVHCIKGTFQTDLAADAQVQLASVSVVDAAGNALNSVVTMPAIAAGGKSRTKVYILAAIGIAQYIIEPEVDVAAAQDNAEEALTSPAGYCPVGLIKVVQSPTDAAASALFTLGVTNMSGVTNQTVTFSSVSVMPATFADVT